MIRHIDRSSTDFVVIIETFQFLFDRIKWSLVEKRQNTQSSSLERKYKVEEGTQSLLFTNAEERKKT